MFNFLLLMFNFFLKCSFIFDYFLVWIGINFCEWPMEEKWGKQYKNYREPLCNLLWIAGFRKKAFQRFFKKLLKFHSSIQPLSEILSLRQRVKWPFSLQPHDEFFYFSIYFFLQGISMLPSISPSKQWHLEVWASAFWSLHSWCLNVIDTKRLAG